MSNLHIYVPTRGRTDRQLTRKWLSLDHIDYSVTYVVPECEEEFWGDQGVEYATVPDSYKFSDIRQAILVKAGKYHVVIDDDLRLAVRGPTGRLLNISAEYTEQHRAEVVTGMLQEIEELLEKGWLHGGVSARQGNNHVENSYKVATREMRFHFYNSEVIRQLGYDFRRTVTKQDLDFTLWMLRRGLPNIVLFHYTQEQCGNNVKGGCSLYRNDTVLREGAERLAQLHTDYVKVVEKNPKKAWGGQPRVDVNIQWLKAYEDGKKYLEELRRKSALTSVERIILDNSHAEAL